ncbi:DUF6879 family protein [Streptomyces bambusae]|uniref:DUF6879 domain-containing protein n=1 Tax=Streptomyces bambusae TaxID=1550616 RepID=A0ABS6YZY8_9ACTN|nr:DUF6879 family protein [Streptomyces bambusae]MBW5481046.1 hypothetical protein [Streptomyces bambusae]
MVPSFEELLAATEHSAVHLEMRDGYMESDPSFIEWQKGRRDLPEDNDPALRPWLRWVREATARGASVRRARVFSVPESDYLKFEHHVSDANVLAGEEIRWLPRRRAADIPLPANDYWVFDGKLALILHFAGNGELAPEDPIELSEDPAILKLCLDAFEAVWERATPHAEYHPS